VLYYEGVVDGNRAALEGNTVAVASFWLLGECDEVIGTEISSFSYVAAARRGLKPILCNAVRHCFRSLKAEPCRGKLGAKKEKKKKKHQKFFFAFYLFI